MSKSNDDIFTIKLPGSELVFTRYLYLKDEVRISLLVSILQKSDDAIFWAYELYYSGFKHELFQLIWKIYYDFFYTLNPGFETYLLKKKEMLNQNECLISSLIQDLLFRPFNTDVFFMRNICETFENETVYRTGIEKITNIIDCHSNLAYWIENNDYRSISNWIINDNKRFNPVDIYQICLELFSEKGIKLTKHNLIKDFKNVLLNVDINVNTILLAKIMALFSRKEGLKKGRSIYISVELKDIMCYETLTGIPGYNILELACQKGINDTKYLNLFKLKRIKCNIKEKYWFHWLYHASFSPIWSQRIRQFKGYPDYLKKKIVFMNDELLEDFHNLYGYDPDEQTKAVQEKSIMPIEKLNNWNKFYSQFKKNGLLEVYDEELDEFDVDGLIY